MTSDERSNPRRKLTWFERAFACVCCLLVATAVWAVPDVITRDAYQTACPAIDDVTSECRNLRYNAPTGLNVNIKGGTAALTQGTAAGVGAGWPTYPAPPTAGTGPFLKAGKATNATVTATVAGVASQSVYLAGVCAGYEAAPPAGTEATITDGTTTVTIGLTNTQNPPGQCSPFSIPLKWASGAALTATVPAAGAGVTGELVIYGYQQ